MGKAKDYNEFNPTMKKHSKNLIGRLSLFALASFLSATMANAQSTWSGGGSPDGNFSNSGNWDTTPATTGGNTMNFGGSANLNATNDMSLSLTADQSINFNAGASAFTIWGNLIRGGGIANNSSSLQTVNLQLRLNGTRTFNTGSAGLQLGQPVGSTSTSGRTVTKTGSGDLIIGSGTASSGGSGYSVSAGTLVFSGSSATSLGTAANGVSLTASGTALRLNNSGTLSMGGAIATVSGSSLTLNNSAAVTVTGGTTIAAGASLTGNGNLGGGLISISGNVAPGLSGIGTMSVSSLTLGSGSTITMEINRSAGQNADLLSASGTLTYGGTLTIDNIGASLIAGDTFNLFDGTLAGTFDATNMPSLDAGLGWDVSQFSSSGIISVMAVPEPASIALLGIGVGMAVWQIRRSKLA